MAGKQGKHAQLLRAQRRLHTRNNFEALLLERVLSSEQGPAVTFSNAAVHEPSFAQPCAFYTVHQDQSCHTKANVSNALAVQALGASLREHRLPHLVSYQPAHIPEAQCCSCVPKPWDPYGPDCRWVESPLCDSAVTQEVLSVWRSFSGHNDRSRLENSREQHRIHRIVCGTPGNTLAFRRNQPACNFWTNCQCTT